MIVDLPAMLIDTTSLDGLLGYVPLRVGDVLEHDFEQIQIVDKRDGRLALARGFGGTYARAHPPRAWLVVARAPEPPSVRIGTVRFEVTIGCEVPADDDAASLHAFMAHIVAFVAGLPIHVTGVSVKRLP